MVPEPNQSWAFCCICQRKQYSSAKIEGDWQSDRQEPYKSSWCLPTSYFLKAMTLLLRGAPEFPGTQDPTEEFVLSGAGVPPSGHGQPWSLPGGSPVLTETLEMMETARDARILISRISVVRETSCGHYPSS